MNFQRRKQTIGRLAFRPLRDDNVLTIRDHQSTSFWNVAMSRPSPSPGLFAVLSVLLAVLLCCASPASAQFKREHLVDVYLLHVGSRQSCMHTFEITDDDYVLTYGDMRMNKEDCPVDSWFLRLYENGDTGDFKIHDIIDENVEHFGGSYLAAKTSELMKCGVSFIGEGTPLLFFRLNDSLTIQATDMFDEDDAKKPAAEDSEEEPIQEIKFRSGYKYLAIGEKCLYRTDKRSSSSTCFPASSTVAMADGSHKHIGDLAIGDAVLSSSPSGHNNNKVVAWAHNSPAVTADFLSLSTHNNLTLTLSPGHYLPVADLGLVPAQRVATGMALYDEQGRPSLIVTHVKAITARGLFNPLTTDGSLVVDGVAVSTFTTAFEPVAAHAALTPLRGVMSAGTGIVGRTIALWFERSVDLIRPIFDNMV